MELQKIGFCVQAPIWLLGAPCTRIDLNFHNMCPIFGWRM